MPIEQTLTSVAIVSRLSELSDGDVLLLADDFRELRETRGYKRVCELVDTAKEKQRVNLENGPTLDAANYARQLGWLAGIRLLPESVEAVIAHAEELERELNKGDTADAGTR